MPGRGQTPPDYSSPIGSFRLLAQDTSYSDLNPAKPGLGMYELFSDAEISGYIQLYEDYSIFRAVGAAYQGLAGRAAMDSKMVKDYDLQVDLTKRAAALQAVADSMYVRAVQDEALNGTGSGFDITDGPTDYGLERAFATPDMWGFPTGSDLAYSIATIGEGINGEGLNVVDGDSEEPLLVDGGDADDLP